MEKQIMKRFLFAAITALLIFTGCKKEDNSVKDGSNTEVSEATLTGTSGKRWNADSVIASTYISTGSIESVNVIYGWDFINTPATIYFIDSKGVNNLYLNYNVDEPLDQVLPYFGSFALNKSKHSITFTCIENPFFECTGNDGEWLITAHYITHGFGRNTEYLELNREVSLAGGGKIMYRIKLSNDVLLAG